MHAMVLNMEQKRDARARREMPEDDKALIDAQNMMGASATTNALRSTLDGKCGHLSLMMHPGVRLDIEQFGNATRNVWDVEAMVSKCNEMPAPFVSANGATALQQHILSRTKNLLGPVGTIKTGLKQ